MKVALVCTVMLVFGCKQKQEDPLADWKEHVRRQSARRVETIVKQLRQDCDSETLQLAISKVESIKKARTKPPATKPLR